MPTLTPRCLSCQHSDLRPLRRYRTHTPYGRSVFEGTSVCACGYCGLLQAYPQPTTQALDDYYVRDYRRAGYAGSDVANPDSFPRDNMFYYNRGQSIAALAGPHITASRPQILDIGAGYGHTLYALGQRFPDSVRRAIEFSETCVSYLRATGVTVLSEPAEKVLPAVGQRFDLIVLSHVVEHLSDPLAVLQLIHTSLEASGILYIEVPHIPELSSRQYPDHVWAPRFDEPHITFYSAPTLQSLLAAAGFEPVFCDTAGPTYQMIPAWRYALPTMRWFIQGLVPSQLFHFLRKQRFTNRLRVQEVDQSFYSYGGNRIWIRSLWRKASNPAI